MNYFIIQDWQNTHGNHAGMVHLCKKIKEKDSNNVKLFIIPNIKIRGRNCKILQNLLYIAYSLYLFIKIPNNKSKVFLMEYLLPTHNQYFIAKVLSRHKQLQLYGLTHLVPSDLDKLFKTDSKLKKWAKPIHGFITLGSSLSEYLHNRNIERSKIHTMFHYVDSDYYFPSSHKTLFNNASLVKIIIMGRMKRDFDSIIEVINSVPNAQFIFCCGRQQIAPSIFKYPQNVRIYNFIPEDKLRSLMEEADISLNIMYDTIGSNVITTSLAMGLAMVVSDVGSIRDYCTNQNTIFCKNNNEIIKSLNYLTQHTELVANMKKASMDLSQKLSIENFYTKLKEL